MIFKPETRSHRIKLYGADSSSFAKAYDTLKAVYSYSEQFLLGISRSWDSSVSLVTIHAATPMLTKTVHEQPQYETIPVLPLYKFPPQIQAILSSRRFRFTRDNVAEFCELQNR